MLLSFTNIRDKLNLIYLNTDNIISARELDNKHLYDQTLKEFKGIVVEIQMSNGVCYCVNGPLRDVVASVNIAN